MFRSIDTFYFVILIIAVSANLTERRSRSIAPPLPPQIKPVSQLCLDCICTMRTNCNESLGCVGGVCGKYKISWGFWADGGKPTVGTEDPDAEGAFQNCAKNADCASDAVQGYMARFSQDCNGDGKVDCHDYMSLTTYGGYGCQEKLPERFRTYADQCVSLDSQH